MYAIRSYYVFADGHQIAIIKIVFHNRCSEKMIDAGICNYYDTFLNIFNFW